MQQAPEQQQLMPGQQCAWDWTGVDLAAWEKEAVPPPQYNPPQLKEGYMPRYVYCCNWWQQRSPLCALPCPPCCLAPCLRRCLLPSAETLQFDKPDEWMVKMLTTGTSPNCPEEWKGLYWLCDNIAPHEHILTFHDADWRDDKFMQKIYSNNFSAGTTAFGTGGLIGAKFMNVKLGIQISPNGKWINMGRDQIGDGMIYRVGPEDNFLLPDGNKLQYEDGLMMRISGIDSNSPVVDQSHVSYQYLVRKIAYLDDQGKLVKTPAYEELRKLAAEPLKFEPSCCQLFYCISPEQQALRNFPMMPTETMIMYAPPPPGA